MRKPRHKEIELSTQVKVSKWCNCSLVLWSLDQESILRVKNYGPCILIIVFTFLNDYYFSIAVVTNYHKLSSSKECKCIILQFCGLMSHGPKIRMFARWAFFLEYLGENPFPCLFCYRSHPYSLAYGPLHFKG